MAQEIKDIPPKEFDKECFLRYQECGNSYYPIYLVGNKKYRLETLILKEFSGASQKSYEILLHEETSPCAGSASVRKKVDEKDIHLFTDRFDFCEDLSHYKIW